MALSAVREGIRSKPTHPGQSAVLLDPSWARIQTGSQVGRVMERPGLTTDKGFVRSSLFPPQTHSSKLIGILPGSSSCHQRENQTPGSFGFQVRGPVTSMQCQSVLSMNTSLRPFALHQRLMGAQWSADLSLVQPITWSWLSYCWWRTCIFVQCNGCQICLFIRTI